MINNYHKFVSNGCPISISGLPRTRLASPRCKHYAGERRSPAKQMEKSPLFVQAYLEPDEGCLNQFHFLVRGVNISRILSTGNASGFTQWGSRAFALKGYSAFIHEKPRSDAERSGAPSNIG